MRMWHLSGWSPIAALPNRLGICQYWQDPTMWQAPPSQLQPQWHWEAPLFVEVARLRSWKVIAIREIAQEDSRETTLAKKCEGATLGWVSITAHCTRPKQTWKKSKRDQNAWRLFGDVSQNQSTKNTGRVPGMGIRKVVRFELPVRTRYQVASFPDTRKVLSSSRQNTIGKKAMI